MSPDQWKVVLGKADATHRSAEEAAADCIISYLAGYPARSKWRAKDTRQLADALVAYAQLLQEAGVTP